MNRDLPQLPAGTHIEFLNITGSGKTEKWSVINRKSTHMLGVIKWHSPWRRYTFQPTHASIYDWLCLRELADFCENATIRHKLMRAHPPLPLSKS